MHKETYEQQEHRNRALAKLSHEGRKYFKFIEFDADEELVSEIRKHPVGLFFILFTGVFIILAVLFAGIFGSVFDFSSMFGVEQANNYRPIFMLLSLLMIAGVTVAVIIAVFLYRSNVIYITSEKIAQVLYISLFNRRISQLSIGDVQDVTVSQKGILAHLFNYGTLVIETAGEQENYKFSYVPDPYQASKDIVGAHERNLVQHGN